MAYTECHTRDKCEPRMRLARLVFVATGLSPPVRSETSYASFVMHFSFLLEANRWVFRCGIFKEVPRSMISSKLRSNLVRLDLSARDTVHRKPVNEATTCSKPFYLCNFIIKHVSDSRLSRMRTVNFLIILWMESFPSKHFLRRSIIR